MVWKRLNIEWLQWAMCIANLSNLGNDLSPLSPVEIPLSNYIFCMGKLHDPTFPRLVEYTDQKQTFTNRFRRQVVTFADSVNRKRRLWKAVTFADVESFMAKP